MANDKMILKTEVTGAELPKILRDHVAKKFSDNPRLIAALQKGGDFCYANVSLYVNLHNSDRVIHDFKDIVFIVEVFEEDDSTNGLRDS